MPATFSLAWPINWTANNKATSVGNQLLSNYKKFLLAYERAYMVRDLPHLVGKVDVTGATGARLAAEYSRASSQVRALVSSLCCGTVAALLRVPCQ